VVCDILLDEFADPATAFLAFVRELSGNPGVNYNNKVFLSEKQAGFKNASLVNLMKAYGNIHNHVDDVLDFYYRACSIEMTCVDLARSFLPFANIPVPFLHSGVTLTKSQIKRINAIMLCCGFYDESGEFAFEVGLPGKAASAADWQPSTPIITAWPPGARESTKRVTRFTECAPSKCLPPSPKIRSFNANSIFEAEKCSFL
jgi:glutaminase